MCCVMKNREREMLFKGHWSCLFILQSGTMRLIFSFNLDDPSGNMLQKHTEKGSKSVQLLSPPRDEPRLPDDAFHHDFLMSEVQESITNCLQKLESF